MKVILHPLSLCSYIFILTIFIRGNTELSAPPQQISLQRDTLLKDRHIMEAGFLAAYLLSGCNTPNIRKLFAAHPYRHLSTFYHTKEKCASILNYILYELFDSSTVRSDNAHVARIINYIDENILEKHTLTSISIWYLTIIITFPGCSRNI